MNAPTRVFGIVLLFVGICAGGTACGFDGEGSASRTGDTGSVSARGNRLGDAAKIAPSAGTNDVIPTKILPNMDMPLDRSERACGMTRSDQRSEVSPVYLDVENTVQAQERAVGCLRIARSRYFAGEAVSLALKLIQDRPCAALDLIHSAMEADLSKSRIGQGDAESWAAGNAARFTRVSSSQLETLAGRAGECPAIAHYRAAGARAALMETARLLRSGNLINVGREGK